MSLRVCTRHALRFQCNPCRTFTLLNHFPFTRIPLKCQLRQFATNNEDSHADFAPKRKLLSDEEAHAMIKKAVSEHPVLLYMKGTPDAPRCGFSANVVKILQHLNCEFSSVDVLQNELIRQGIKSFSDWPTLPQLYIKGEFVGGSDIISQLFKSGELKQLLKDAGAIQPKQTETKQE